MHRNRSIFTYIKDPFAREMERPREPEERGQSETLEIKLNDTEQFLKSKDSERRSFCDAQFPSLFSPVVTLRNLSC